MRHVYVYIYANHVYVCDLVVVRLVCFFSSLKIDKVGMTTSASTYNFDVLFIDNFRERRRSRCIQKCTWIPSVPSQIRQLCWAVFPTLFPFHSMCVYWCRRGQILLVFMISRSSALRSCYRTSVNLYLKRKPLSDHRFHGFLGQ